MVKYAESLRFSAYLSRLARLAFFSPLHSHQSEYWARRSLLPSAGRLLGIGTGLLLPGSLSLSEGLGIVPTWLPTPPALRAFPGSTRGDWAPLPLKVW